MLFLHRKSNVGNLVPPLLQKLETGLFFHHVKPLSDSFFLLFRVVICYLLEYCPNNASGGIVARFVPTRPGGIFFGINSQGFICFPCCRKAGSALKKRPIFYGIYMIFQLFFSFFLFFLFNLLPFSQFFNCVYNQFI